MEMIDREKVIKGLENIVSDMQEEIDEWRDYSDSELSHGLTCDCEWWYNTAQMLKDALALLKARLLTEADFIDNPNVDGDGCLPAYIEFRRDEEWAEYWKDTIDEWAPVRKNNFKAAGYRSWDKRPTKEQMEATPWNY